MSLAALASNVLDGVRFDLIPGETKRSMTMYEVWQHSDQGWMYLIDYPNKQHAEIHAGSLNSHPYYQKMGFTYHVIEIEVHVRAKRKRLNP